jgi:hypothetical protein
MKLPSIRNEKLTVKRKDLSYQASTGLRPVSKQTARAMGWLVGVDREVVSKILPLEPTRHKPEDFTKCDICNEAVLKKNIEKHRRKSHGCAEKSIANEVASQKVVHQKENVFVSCLLCRPSMEGINSNGMRATRLSGHIKSVHKLDNPTQILEKYYCLPVLKPRKRYFLTEASKLDLLIPMPEHQSSLRYVIGKKGRIIPVSKRTGD